jgi:hypothetical protein
MENRAGPLTRAGSYGLRAAWMALTGEDPDLVSAPRAYSVSSSCPCVPVGDDSRSSSANPSSASINRGSVR